MSTYSGRRGPNVSQYIRELNTITSQDATTEEAFPIEEDLSLFANTQFFDFDSGEHTDFQAQPVKPNAKPATVAANGATPSVNPADLDDIPNIDYIPDDFPYTEFTYAASNIGVLDGTQQTFPNLPAGPDFLYVNTQVQSSQQPQQQQQTSQPAPFPQNNVAPLHQSESDSPGGLLQTSYHDGDPRQAAEDDKRRRNTAASARFRVKKKQREQALEKSAKEMTEKVSALESKVGQLETENKWLKNLLVEKNEGTGDITSLWKDFVRHANDKKGSAADLKKESASS